MVALGAGVEVTQIYCGPSVLAAGRLDAQGLGHGRRCAPSGDYPPNYQVKAIELSLKQTELLAVGETV